MSIRAIRCVFFSLIVARICVGWCLNVLNQEKLRFAAREYSINTLMSFPMCDAYCITSLLFYKCQLICFPLEFLQIWMILRLNYELHCTYWIYKKANREWNNSTKNYSKRALSASTLIFRFGFANICKFYAKTGRHVANQHVDYSSSPVCLEDYWFSFEKKKFEIKPEYVNWKLPLGLIAKNTHKTCDEYQRSMLDFWITYLQSAVHAAWIINARVISNEVCNNRYMKLVARPREADVLGEPKQPLLLPRVFNSRRKRVWVKIFADYVNCQ